MLGSATSRKAISTGLFLVAAVATLSRTSYGSVIVFDSEDAFLRTGLVVSTETFDEFPLSTVIGIETAVIDGITYTSDQVNTRWIAGIQIHQVPPRYVSPPNDFGTSEIGTDTLTFGEGGSTDAIGFYILTAGVETTYNITLTSADGQVVIEPLLFNPNPSFRGFVALEGIKSVVVLNAFPFSRINYSFDNVSRGPIVPGPIVPEPCPLLLLTAGLTGVALYWWALRGFFNR